MIRLIGRCSSATAALACVAVLAGPARVVADDASSGVPLPGLRARPTGCADVSATVVHLREDRAEVSLTLRVRGGPCSLLLKTPRFGWLGGSEPYPARHFPELQIQIDGQRTNVDDGFAAFVGGTEITGAIREAGVDPFAIAETPPVVADDARHARELGALERMGGLSRADPGLIARWEVERTIAVKVAPGRHVLTLRYAARPGFRLTPVAALDAADLANTYCSSREDVARALERLGGAQADVVLRSYDISVSIEGKPVRSASALVDAGGGGGRPVLTAFCGPDGKPARAGTGHAEPARADRSGVLHILSLLLPSTAP